MSIERGGVASRNPERKENEARKMKTLALVDRETEMLLERKYGAFLSREDK